MLSPDKFESFVYAKGNDTLDHILINGRGLQVNSVNPPQVPLSTFKVEFGYKYRFRVINIGSFTCPMEFSIDDHPLLMIATDGSSIKPVWVESFFVFTGKALYIRLE